MASSFDGALGHRSGPRLGPASPGIEAVCWAPLKTKIDRYCNPQQPPSARAMTSGGKMDEFLTINWIAYEREDELAIRAINGCPSLSAHLAGLGFHTPAYQPARRPNVICLPARNSRPDRLAS